MRQALKVFGFIFAVICTLSITVKDKPLFNYVYQAISPATTMTQRGVVAAYHFSAEKVQEFAKKLIDNSVPRVDTVKSKLSGPTRKKSQEEPSEKIAPEEKEQLDDLIKSYAR